MATNDFLLAEIAAKTGRIRGSFAGDPNAHSTPATVAAPWSTWLVDESQTPQQLWFKQFNGTWVNIAAEANFVNPTSQIDATVNGTVVIAAGTTALDFTGAYSSTKTIDCVNIADGATVAIHSIDYIGTVTLSGTGLTFTGSLTPFIAGQVGTLTRNGNVVHAAKPESVLNKVQKIESVVPDFTASQFQYPSLLATTTAVNTSLAVGDVFDQFILSGLDLTMTGGLDTTLSAGVAYIGGEDNLAGSFIPVGRIVRTADNLRTHLTFRDTYVDLTNLGYGLSQLNYVTTSNGNPPPTQSLASLRLWKIVTNGTGVTSIERLAPTQPTFKTPITVPDAVVAGDAANKGQLDAAILVETNRATDAEADLAADIVSGDAATLAAANTYADGLVVGLWDDRGHYDASVNTFPASGGSGTAGAILKGDIWSTSVVGTLGGVDVGLGDTIRALVDTPAQTASNWALSENNLGYAPQPLNANLTAESGLTGAADKISYFTGLGAKALADFKAFGRTLAALVGVADLGPVMHTATAKTTPVDADEIGVFDSAASWALKVLTFANLWVWIKGKADLIYSSRVRTPVALVSVSGTLTIDCSVTEVHKTVTLFENIGTWTFTNRPAAGSFIKVFVRVQQDAATARTVVSPASASSTAGGTWTQSPTLASVEMLEMHVGNTTVELFPSGVYQ